jgi:hypothetical protein
MEADRFVATARPSTAQLAIRGTPSTLVGTAFESVSSPHFLIGGGRSKCHHLTV